MPADLAVAVREPRLFGQTAYREVWYYASGSELFRDLDLGAPPSLVFLVTAGKKKNTVVAANGAEAAGTSALRALLPWRLPSRPGAVIFRVGARDDSSGLKLAPVMCGLLRQRVPGCDALASSGGEKLLQVNLNNNESRVHSRDAPHRKTCLHPCVCHSGSLSVKVAEHNSAA